MLIVRSSLVLYNAALVAAANNAPPVLRVGGQEMAGFVHSPPALALLALPGQNVTFVRGAITPNQVATHRPSYLNAILIQSRGVLQAPACTACAAVRPGLRPFPECRRAPGHFGGCCGNCKWRDHGARCSANDPESDSSSDDDEDGGRLAIEGTGGGDGATAATAIVLA